MGKSIEQWVSLMTRWFDEDLTRINKLRSYTTGSAVLPELNHNTSQSWKKFQKMALTNAGLLIVSTLAERIIPNGIIIGDQETGKEVEIARRIWRDNRMDVVVQDALRDAFTLGKGYLLITEDDETGKAVITRERPEMFYAVQDPLKPWKALAAVKVWRDPVGENDYLILWADGLTARFSRKTTYMSRKLETVTYGWKLEPQTVRPYDGEVPVVILENRDGKGEFEDHLHLIDRINWIILQMLATTSMQAFKQRALQASAETGGLPQKDADGNDIDYSRIFEPAPGALWELPPGISIWESSQTDVTPMLSQIKSAWQELAAHTSTPLSTMLPDAANQSAAGAEAPQRSLVDKARDRISRVKPALAVCMVKALAVENMPVNDTLEVLFEPPHAVSMTEKYAAAAQARAAGESLETIQRNILGYSPQQVAADKARRAADQLLGMFQTGVNSERTRGSNPPISDGVQTDSSTTPTMGENSLGRNDLSKSGSGKDTRKRDTTKS